MLKTCFWTISTSGPCVRRYLGVPTLEASSHRTKRVENGANNFSVLVLCRKDANSMFIHATSVDPRMMRWINTRPCNALTRPSHGPSSYVSMAHPAIQQWPIQLWIHGPSSNGSMAHPAIYPWPRRQSPEHLPTPGGAPVSLPPEKLTAPIPPRLVSMLTSGNAGPAGAL
jgi:hypothetical protein